MTRDVTTVGTQRKLYGLPWGITLELVEKAGLAPVFESQRGKTLIKYYETGELKKVLDDHVNARKLAKAAKHIKVSPAPDNAHVEQLLKLMEHDHNDMSKDVERLLDQVGQLITQNQVLNHRITKMQEELLASQKQQMEAVIRAFGGRPEEVLG